MKRVVALLISIALACVVALASGAKAQADRGDIRGEVTDPAGAVLPNAKVTITKKGTDETRETTANPHGDFSFANLEAGKYVVRVEAANFKSMMKKAIVKAGRDTTINFKLELRERAATVE